MARYIYQALLRWLRSVDGTTLYPRATQKAMSRETTREFYLYKTGKYGEDRPPINQWDYLRLWHRENVKLPGATEMRQKWYPSGVKPRTYYAQGGTHYAAGCALQDIFSSLVNCYEVTNHISRLQPTRLIIPNGAHLRIYDLTSFTSRMEEQHAFCRCLSDFCRGTIVHVVDPHMGVVPHDLGEMLDDYNDVCNYYPAISFERLRHDFYMDNLADHGLASALGIFGNLMTCTLAHGSLVSMVVDNPSELNVAGDDGACKEDESNAEELDLCICALGSYERSKTFSSEEEGCICLKRPLSMVLGSVTTLPMCIPPSLSLIRHYLFNDDDPRYQFFDNDLSTSDKISIVGKDLMRFLRSVHRCQWRLSDTDLEIARSTLISVTSRFALPFQGSLRNCGDPFFWPACTSIDELRLLDPLDSLITRRFVDNCSMYEQREEDPVQWVDLVAGNTFQCNSNRQLSLLRKLGYVEGKKVVRHVYGQEALNMLRKSFDDRKTPVVYEYHVLDTPPVSLRSLFQ
jgi:hypothetical protein